MSASWAHFADRVALGVAKPAHLLQSMVGNQETLPKRLERYEETLIRETLAAHNGNVQETIEALGIPRKTFYDKMQRHGINRADYRANGD
jgi:two-component system C4-dicarboxylate transport response regulator DctD